MIDKPSSGKKLKNRITKPYELESSVSAFTQYSPQDPQRKTTEDEVDLMANLTYQRVLKSKKQPNINPQLFQTYIQNKTNIDRISALKQTQQDNMDTRDKRIIIPFQSIIYQQYTQNKAKFDCELFLEEIRDWLIDVIEIVTSIAFNQFKKKELTLNETKNYTAKNIMLNVKELFEKYNNLSLENRVELMKFVNLQTLKIFDHIMNKYPQNSGNRASKRVKNKIPKIDNRENDEFDFLRNNGINIQYKENGDYSQDIMKTVNKLISFSTETFDPRDQNQQSNFEVFTEIMEYIFDNAAIQPVKTTTENICTIIRQKNGIEEDLNAIKNLVGLAFNLGNELAFKEEQQKQKKDTQKETQPKEYAICHKIPAGTKQFSQEEIQGCQFKANDASILRILTKWVEELYNKLSNSEDAIYTRLYKFKDHRGKLINLNLDLRQELYQAARKEHKTAKEYMNYLRKQNGYLQTLFAGQTNTGKYSKLDTKIGMFSAKINEIGSQYIFKHLNKLIHCLLTTSRTASNNRSNQAQKLVLQSINLVTLKIGDLLRCKHSCSQLQFLRILDILDQIHLKYPQILKIVRIKNRLQKNDNDVLINLFFMNKAECELQLSIKGNINETQKKYGDFCHLIYEITRARLGPITEMSSIITNHDPLARLYAKQKSYGPQLKEEYFTRNKKRMLFSKIKEEISLKIKQSIGNTVELPFICRSCRSLAVLSNPCFLYQQEKEVEIDCNQCRFKDMQSDQSTATYQYIIEQNFKHKTEETKRFIMNHISFWNSQSFIHSLTIRNSQKSLQFIPPFGLLMPKNQKKPKLCLYSTAIEPSDGSFIFAHLDSTFKPKIISKLILKYERAKHIENIKEQFNKLLIFQFTGVDEKVQDKILSLLCVKQNCCNQQCQIGPILQPEDIIQISQKQYLSKLIEHQKSVLRMNLIKDAFRKLQEVLTNLERRGIATPKFLRAVEVIKAYRCQISTIQIVKNFPNLFEINISDNRSITSLKGIENCKYIKNLEARNCDLRNLDDLKGNIRVQYINASRNFNLRCIKGLQDHCHLVELIINNTSVSDLSPLRTCPSLEILDIQNCNEISSIKDVNTMKLSFLNTYGCLNLPQDPNQSLINSLMKKSHFPMKRSNSQIQQIANSNIYGLPENMSKSYEFEPLMAGWEYIYKAFTTVMHESPEQSEERQQQNQNPYPSDDIYELQNEGPPVQKPQIPTSEPITSLFKLFI